jgi:hypothetical protein
MSRVVLRMKSFAEAVFKCNLNEISFEEDFT